MKPSSGSCGSRCRLLPVLLLAACGTSGATGGGTGSVAPTEPDAVAFSASATAPTEEQAYALARRRLLASLLADEALVAPHPLGERLALAIHVRNSDPLRFVRGAAGTEAQVGLGRASLRSVFGRLDTALTTAPEPSEAHALARAIHGLRVASLRRASCLRQRQLVPDLPCEPVDLAPDRRRVEETLAAVRLHPVYADGIPTAHRSWLRSLAVRASLAETEGERPLPGIPLRIQSSDGSRPVVARTDVTGIAQQPIPKGTPISTTWTVALDLDELLDPAAKVAPLASTTVRGRPTGLARSAVVHAHGKPPALETGRALLAALAGQVTQPLVLADADARQLAEAGVAKMKDVAPKAAERMAGALDTILLLDSESEFASRMGTERVWYEARGTLRVVDAWSGELLSEVSATVTEAGRGDERAERGARESLGHALAAGLAQKLGVKLAQP